MTTKILAALFVVVATSAAPSAQAEDVISIDRSISRGTKLYLGSRGTMNWTTCTGLAPPTMQVQQAPRFGRLYTAQETRTVMAADDGVKGCIGKRNKVIAIYYESGSERGTDSFAFRLTGYQSRIVRYTMHVQ